MSDAGPPPMAPEEAAERWLNKRRADLSEQTLTDYWYRLKVFVDWCDAEEIATMQALTPWQVDSFDAERAGADLAPITLRNHQRTVKQWLEWCEDIGIAAEGIAAPIQVPDVDREHHVDDTRLDAAAAKALIEQFRDGARRASLYHVTLEILWYVGCRTGGLRGLDVGDVDREAGVLEFRHRPDTGTPLKNGVKGERDVGVGAETMAVLGEWIDDYRPRVRDEHGRTPLVASPRGRMAGGTIQTRVYHGTVPCRYQQCPHGEDPDTCDWNSLSSASKCPSSRSPHQVRTGSITWQVNRGVPLQVVARRVNASVRTLKKHYDKPSKREAFEQRERQHLDKIDFEDGGTTNP